MSGINKHLEKADRFLQKGKVEAALEELLLARQDEPGNDSIILALADTYQRLNRLVECRQCYGYLFDKYVERAAADKALGFFRKIQKMGAVEPKRLIACARLMEKQTPKEATEYYTQALESAGAQDTDTALQCLEGLGALQPTSLELQQRLAELASKMGKKELAASAYSKLGELLFHQKKYAESADALENAFLLSGESPPVQMALAKASSRAQRFQRVLELLGTHEPPSEDPETLALLAEAYHAEKLLPKAEAAYWKLVESSPGAFTSLTDIAMEYLRQHDVAVALPLLKKLEERLSAPKQQSGLIALAEKLSHVEDSGIAVLEYLCVLADRIHLDRPLETALDSLFDLYFAAGDIHKATDALERLIDIDGYAADRSVKLRKLEGKADPGMWKELASRLGRSSTTSSFASAAASPAASPIAEAPGSQPLTESDSGNALGDLILQAEIFLQYRLQDKARERLGRIARLFPGEEAKNEELRQLYERAGFVPQIAPAPARPAAAPVVDAQADWTRMAEIIRNMGRQGTVKGVLSAAVNGIGRLWQSSRCVAGLATPKQPPTLALEYTSSGAQPSDAALLGKLVMGLQLLTEEQGSPLVAEKVSEVRRLAPLKTMLASMQIESLVAVPLREEEQPAGILVLEQCGTSRNWSSNDVAALETLADQMVLAASNARLRALMKTLAVTDERSGLLHRDSYLTCLLSEAERMREQQTPLAAAILEFSAQAAASKRQDETLEAFLQQFRSTFASHLRQNDIPLKYGPHSLAVILPATTGKQAVFMVEKMRKLAASFSLPGAAAPPTMAAGVAEAVRDGDMDGSDIVTELINRVESALEEAQATGGGSTKVLEPPSLPR